MNRTVRAAISPVLGVPRTRGDEPNVVDSGTLNPLRSTIRAQLAQVDKQAPPTRPLRKRRLNALRGRAGPSCSLPGQAQTAVPKGSFLHADRGSLLRAD